MPACDMRIALLRSTERVASPNGIPGGDRTRDPQVSSRARLHVATTADRMIHLVSAQTSDIFIRGFDEVHPILTRETRKTISRQSADADPAGIPEDIRMSKSVEESGP